MSSPAALTAMLTKLNVDDKCPDNIAEEVLAIFNKVMNLSRELSRPITTVGHALDLLLVANRTGNADFYAFKASGKYYTHSRGFYNADRHLEGKSAILFDQGGCWPGLNSDGAWLTCVIIPDAEDGVPRMFPAEQLQEVGVVTG